MINQERVPTTARAAEHFMGDPMRPGISRTITYKFRNTAGTSMHVHVGVDEYGVLHSMVINVGSSGTTIHNIVNALGRVISIAIQNDKATALKIVHTIEGFSSDTVWMSDELGTAKSIPDVIALILLRHIDIETHIENTHTGEEEDDAETRTTE